ncbi:hypothetical protein MMC31_001237 [Peltigera leucophlebia]|nr:hypothetical protein [Peltigera leucophlebia]
MKTTNIFSAVCLSLLASPVAAQTYSSCNPLMSSSCPPDAALGKSVTIDFTSGPSDSFTPQGSPSYSSSGASFTVGKSGDSPQLTSKWYIMFGHVDFVLKPAPGVGIVSSAVLQSDDLDEIDWEWLGADNNQVQTNYFGKGQTTTYNRGAFHPNPNNQGGFKKYSIDWTANSISWQIDGTTVRTLTPETSAGQYPQTPMLIKVGAWSGGDSSNAPGTIAWAGGSTNYASGPYTMQVKSIAVTDYSTGTQYVYSGSSGTWESIQAVGGKVNSGGGKGVTPVDPAPPTITGANSAPMPFGGTHRDTSSTYVTPDIYPWVATTLKKSPAATVTTYPGLPSGWTVTDTGKVLPPSAAPQTSQPALPTSLPSASRQDSLLGGGGGLETFQGFDEKGFPITLTRPISEATAAKHYNEQGFLVTDAPAKATATFKAIAESAGPTLKATTAPTNTAAGLKRFDWKLSTIFAMFLGGTLAV